jgi:hypothetical protein
MMASGYGEGVRIALLIIVAMPMVVVVSVLYVLISVAYPEYDWIRTVVRRAEKKQ